MIGKSKGRERRCRLAGYADDCFLATGLDQAVSDQIEIRCHSAKASRRCSILQLCVDNHVLMI